LITVADANFLDVIKLLHILDAVVRWSAAAFPSVYNARFLNLMHHRSSAERDYGWLRK